MDWRWIAHSSFFFLFFFGFSFQAVMFFVLIVFLRNFFNFVERNNLFNLACQDITKVPKLNNTLQLYSYLFLDVTSRWWLLLLFYNFIFIYLFFFYAKNKQTFTIYLLLVSKDSSCMEFKGYIAENFDKCLFPGKLDKLLIVFGRQMIACDIRIFVINLIACLFKL